MNIFYVGMKVICVTDIGPVKPLPFPYPMPNRPVRGCVYTVREVTFDRAGEVGILVRELSNPNWRVVRNDIYEPAFYAWRFRPVAENGIFTQHKIGRRVKERA